MATILGKTVNFGDIIECEDGQKAVYLGTMADGDPCQLETPHAFKLENDRPDSIIWYNSSGETKHINSPKLKIGRITKINIDECNYYFATEREAKKYIEVINERRIEPVKPTIEHVNIRFKLSPDFKVTIVEEMFNPEAFIMLNEKRSIELREGISEKLADIQVELLASFITRTKNFDYTEFTSVIHCKLSKSEERLVWLIIFHNTIEKTWEIRLRSTNMGLNPCPLPDKVPEILYQFKKLSFPKTGSNPFKVAEYNNIEPVIIDDKNWVYFYDVTERELADYLNSLQQI